MSEKICPYCNGRGALPGWGGDYDYICKNCDFRGLVKETNVDSPARKKLHVKFSELPVDSKFQLVNSVMNAAVPGTPTFVKIPEVPLSGYNARYLISGKLVRIRSNAIVEIVSQP